MNVEQSDDSFWEEHKLGLGMTVGGLFAAAGALAMHRLAKQHNDLANPEPPETIIDQSGEATQD